MVRMTTFSSLQRAIGGTRFAVAFGIFVCTFAVVTPIVGILGSSNIVWGEDNQYGRINIPGTKTLNLPAGDILGSIAVALPGRGNDTPILRLPSDVSLGITPMNGKENPTVTQDIGSSDNAADDLDDTQRQVWRIHIPTAGEYQIEAAGSFDGLGVNPQLWLGHGPPLPGSYVPLIGALVGLCVAGVWLISGRKRTVQSEVRSSDGRHTTL
jgi:hypothetical protein